ncbi:hypothetical protein TH47_06265 [Thalassospira sp. MCCC 1A02803]|nr:hypothetical protein AUQ41_12530 [Thalassospira sp. MCCC 1A02898]ONH85286.1 hypothetical protein TH47_06265 [Thalassospira sp. MCCC 1A02803]
MDVVNARKAEELKRFQQLGSIPGVGPETIVINEVLFYGNDNVENSELQQVIEAFLKRPLTAADLSDAALAVSDVYHQRGFLAAQVVVPPQEIVDGRVAFWVLEGYLDKDGIVLDDYSNDTVSIDYIKRILTREITEGSPIERHEYERALRIVEDLPGVHVESRIFPGTEVGTGRLGVDIYQTEPLTALLSYDNSGFYGTGIHRATAFGRSENVFGGHEALSLTFSTSGSAQRYVGVDGDVPLGSAGWKIGALASYMDYAMRDEYNTSNEHGWGTVFGVRAYYPLMLLRDTTVSVTASLNRSVMADEYDDYDDYERNVDVAEMTFHGDHADLSGVTSFAAHFFAGHVDITEGTDFGKTEGGFGVAELHASRLQEFGNRFNGYVEGKLQVSTQNLDGLMRCSIGGPDSNRGYAVGEVSADQCFVVNSDIRYDLDQDLLPGAAQVGAFVDYSLSQQDHTDISGVDNHRNSLASIGVLANLQVSDSSFLNASLGYQLTESEEKKSLGNQADYRSSPVRFWLQAVIQF